MDAIKIEVVDIVQAYADELSREKHKVIMLTLENQELRELLEEKLQNESK